MKTYLGIDIADTSIEIVELSQAKTGYALDSYTRTKIPSEVVIQGRIKQHDVLLDAFEKAFKAARPIPFTSQEAIIGLPNSLVYSATYILKPKPKDDINEILTTKAVTTFLIEEEHLYIQWIEHQYGDSKSYTVFGVDKRAILEWQHLFTELGLKIIAIEPAMVATLRGIMAERSLELQQQTVVIADIGESRTNITFFYDGLPILSELILSGGHVWTSQLAHKKKLTFEEAEQQKITTGLNNAELKPIIEPFVNDFITKLENYSEKYQLPVKTVYLTGGNASMLGFVEYFKTLVVKKHLRENKLLCM